MFALSIIHQNTEIRNYLLRVDGVNLLSVRKQKIDPKILDFTKFVSISLQQISIFVKNDVLAL